MNYKAELATEFTRSIANFHASPGMQRLFSGTLGRAHYAAYLRETFHYTRENPQIQALASVFFRGAQRAAVKPFLRHAISEVGHDQLALNDMAALGWEQAELDAVRTAQPLPATTALIAYPYYQIYNHNVVGYLGYLYFLEFMPTSFGREYADALRAMRIPPGAMSFLHDHSTIDVGHNRLMQGYINTLLNSEADLQAAIYSMRVTATLYANLVTEAFTNADVAPNSIGSFGVNTAERSNYSMPVTAEAALV